MKTYPSTPASREISTILREARMERQVTQRKLSELSGVDARMISFIERGMIVPSLSVIMKISIALEEGRR